MQITTLFLLSALQTASPSPILSTVPEDAYTLVHCTNAAALRERAQLNDWYKLLESEEGEPLLTDLSDEIERGTHSDMDNLLQVADALEGEFVFFDTQTVAGFVTDPPNDRTELVKAIQEWMPSGDGERRRLDLAGGVVDLIAWPNEIDGWSGRAGHFAAFVDHPRIIGVYSGDSADEVLQALTLGVKSLTTPRQAPVVRGYLAAGGGKHGGVEVYVDFTPLADEAEAAMRDAVEGMLPDPTDLLGIDQGSWLHVATNFFPGTRVESTARLHIPQDTLLARLADTFRPLPADLASRLPQGIWSLWALQWDLKTFYSTVRTAYEEAGKGDGLAMVDGGIAAAQAMADVDPIDDVLNQLSGLIAFHMTSVAGESMATESFRGLGLQLGLLDQQAFFDAFEKLLGAGGMAEAFNQATIAGADAYLIKEDGDQISGLAFPPNALIVGLSRSVLERSIQALSGVASASAANGSRMQAAIEENSGACFLTCMELTPLRSIVMSAQTGELEVNPFDAQLVSFARRTPSGFELRIYTR